MLLENEIWNQNTAIPNTPQSKPPIAYPRDPPSPAIIVNVERPMAWSSKNECDDIICKNCMNIGGVKLSFLCM